MSAVEEGTLLVASSNQGEMVELWQLADAYEIRRGDRHHRISGGPQGYWAAMQLWLREVERKAELTVELLAKTLREVLADPSADVRVHIEDQAAGLVRWTFDVDSTGYATTTLVQQRIQDAMVGGEAIRIDGTDFGIRFNSCDIDNEVFLERILRTGVHVTGAVYYEVCQRQGNSWHATSLRPTST